MRIAVLSDIHEGLNRKRTGKNIIGILRDWIVSNQPDCFIMAGDLTNKPAKTTAILQDLQAGFPQTKFLFVHGNHDVYAENSNEAVENMQTFPGDLSNGPVQLNDDWVVIGTGGWYDYSLAVQGFKQTDFEKGQYGDFIWPDKLHANWGKSDQAVTQVYLAQLEAQLKKHHHKNIIMVTHFVPFKKFTIVKNQASWDFFNAMMGSQSFGDLALKYQVKKYIFGHIHHRYAENYRGIEILCNPLGYYPHEWVHETAETEINHAIQWIEI